MLAWSILAFANNRLFKKKCWHDDIFTYPLCKVATSLQYIRVQVTTLAPAGKVVALLYY
jgi:hypothetical protein